MLALSLLPTLHSTSYGTVRMQSGSTYGYFIVTSLGVTKNVTNAFFFQNQTATILFSGTETCNPLLCEKKKILDTFSFVPILLLVRQWPMIIEPYELSVSYHSLWLNFYKRKTDPPFSLFTTSSEADITFSYSLLDPLDCVNIVGINVISNLSWQSHISSIVESASEKPWILFRYRLFLFSLFFIYLFIFTTIFSQQMSYSSMREILLPWNLFTLHPPSV